MEVNRIIQGDCINVLKTFPDDCVDCVITDPPYNIGGKSSKLTMVGSNVKSNSEVLGEWDDIQNYFEWTRMWLEEIHRVCRGGVFCFFDLNEIGKLRDVVTEVGFYPKNFIILVKNNPLPHIRKTGYRSGFEIGLMFMKNKDSKFNFLTQREMINVKYYNIGDKQTAHPTEKPEGIINHLISVLSDKDDLVLDLFLGSGTTAVVAKKLGRNYIGIEQKSEYVKMAEDRVNGLSLPMFN